MFNNASNWRTSILFNETKESFAEKADFYSNCMCVRYEKKLIDMRRFNMRRFVKKKLKKTQPLLSHFPIVCGFKLEKSGRDFSLELCEFILAFEDMITTFTTLSYFNYGDITVPRHCGKCFYKFLASPRD